VMISPNEPLPCCRMGSRCSRGHRRRRTSSDHTGWRKPELDALGQVRIGDKMTTESDQVGVSLLNNRLGGVGLETSSAKSLADKR
jgi:hypothetical protein